MAAPSLNDSSSGSGTMALAGASRYGAFPPWALKPITCEPWMHIWV
jgi:hypothetical protein